MKFSKPSPNWVPDNGEMLGSNMAYPGDMVVTFVDNEAKSFHVSHQRGYMPFSPIGMAIDGVRWRRSPRNWRLAKRELHAGDLELYKARRAESALKRPEPEAWMGTAYAGQTELLEEEDNDEDNSDT